MSFRILVRGGGDLASGLILRLFRAGWQVLVTELEKPLVVRRTVSFAEAVYRETFVIEGVLARKVSTLEAAQETFAAGAVPVMVDDQLSVLEAFKPHVLVDARMRKNPPETGIDVAPLVIGLGPGFTAGKDCHAVVETNRGPNLGRVYWQGQAQADTGIPERRGQYRAERVLRAPVEGSLDPVVEIGALLKQGAVIAYVNDKPVIAPFEGVLRGLIHAGLPVRAGDKIGDLDPSGDPRLCRFVSDKSLAVAGGVLEAVLSWNPIRQYWRES